MKFTIFTAAALLTSGVSAVSLGHKHLHRHRHMHRYRAPLRQVDGDHGYNLVQHRMFQPEEALGFVPSLSDSILGNYADDAQVQVHGLEDSDSRYEDAVQRQLREAANDRVKRESEQEFAQSHQYLRKSLYFNKFDGLIHAPNGRIYDDSNNKFKEIQEVDGDYVQLKDDGGLALSGDGMLVDSGSKGLLKEVNYDDLSGGVKEQLNQMTNEVEYQPHVLPGAATFFEKVEITPKTDKYGALMAQVPAATQQMTQVSTDAEAKAKQKQSAAPMKNEMKALNDLQESELTASFNEVWEGSERPQE